MILADGIHFNIFSTGEQVQLLLFDRVDDARPARVMDLERQSHPSGHYWRGFAAGARAGQAYGYRVRGPSTRPRGSGFDPEKLLLDPYARGIGTPQGRSRAIDTSPGDNVATALRSIAVDSSAYDWGADRPPRVPHDNSVIYEMHVGHFTRHPSAGLPAELRGTFAGLIEKIPYLVDLGITAVELMPVFAFDAQAAPRGLHNVWGYEPLSFFALHQPYAARQGIGAAVNEFRDLTRALHRAGIEIILDVVYNHSAEDGATGPTLCFKGLANEVYYLLRPDGGYVDYSGTGNTLDAHSPIVLRLILDSLRYWATEMRVDGFRFDLAGVFLRDGAGRLNESSPLLRAIAADPLLKDIQLIAEAWDAAGLYGLGRFASQGWREWNGQFRDDTRRFLKSAEGTAWQMARRLAGSPDIYPAQRCAPAHTINFVTSHDGFTLNDLVSYNGKHNEGNREDNRDGAGENHSWNCGAEGPTADVSVLQLRTRQIKNFLTLTVLSTGTPMLLMGDEIRRTQHGNNNGYCLDEEGIWFDWRDLAVHAEIHRFARELIALRTGRLSATRRLLAGGSKPPVPREMEWHGVRARQPDWSEHSHSLAVRIDDEYSRQILYLAANAYWEPLTFELPAPPLPRRWRRCIDTSLSSPDDIRLDSDAPAVSAASVRVQPRSVLVLLADDGSSTATAQARSRQIEAAVAAAAR